MSNNLEITGKLVKLLPQVTGQGKNGQWTKQEFVIETTTEQYPKKVCMSAWGEKADALRNVKVGDEVKVSFNIESREYNERWYTDVRAWRIERAAANAADLPPYQPEANTAGAVNYGSGGNSFESFQGGPTDDLPF